MDASIADLLSAKQLAEYLQLSQRTVYRLLERGGIPALKVGGQWRFRRAAVDDWLEMATHRLDAASLRALEGDEGAGGDEEDAKRRYAPRRIAELISPANARIRLAAGPRDDVVRRFIAQVRFPEPVSVDVVAERVLERERLCSTALTDGVALLHTPRGRPRVLNAHDLVAIGRLETPIDFAALDGSRTDILILLLARSERDQLALLAKLARLCREPSVLADLHAARDGDEVIDRIRQAEDRLFVPAQV